jgi:hypothetical protein
MKFFNNIFEAFTSNEAKDSGRLVETILLISGFAIVAIAVVAWIGNAIAAQGANVATCVTQANISNRSAIMDVCGDDYVQHAQPQISSRFTTW